MGLCLGRAGRPLLLFAALSWIAACGILSPGAFGEEESEEREEPAGDGREDSEGVIELAPIIVRSFREVTAASDVRIRGEDFLFLPRQTPSDLLRLMPGIHVQQHTGGGKAHQMFLRGFDAEHGQDLAGFLDGAPLNEVSQVHGQGYLDLHFLIPETLEAVRVTKGGYATAHGNFAVAGAVDFIPVYRGTGNFLSLSAGKFGTLRSLLALSQAGEESAWTCALERSATEGFTRPGNMDSCRAFASLEFQPAGETRLRAFFVHYNAAYMASDVVPVDWIETGLLGRFHGLDPSDGGESNREMLGAILETRFGDLVCKSQFYYCYRKTVLFSNYTYFLFDRVNGDQHGLFDERSYVGLNASAAVRLETGGLQSATRIGLSARLDGISLSQTNARQRETLNRLYKYSILEGSLGIFAEEALEISNALKLVAGLRADMELYDVTGTQDFTEFDIFTNTYVKREDVPRARESVLSALSPKASLVLTPLDDDEGTFNRLRFFANFGMGFVTPRAQSMANFEEDAMPRTCCGEAAVQVEALSRALSLQLVGWWADKETELVFEPETGLSADRGESRRYGLEVEARWKPLPWLLFGADFYATRAFFRETGEAIPGTPERVFIGNISLRHPGGLRAVLKCRWLGSRPLAKNVTSSPFWLFDLGVGYEEEDSWSLDLEIENLFDAEWDDTSFYYESRPDPSLPAASRKHITPGTPFSLKMTFKVYF
jgi:outer membrane receptor protein involved in Fe transport